MMDYASLVGTQVMAVLNPLLAIMQENGKPQKVGLFHTFKTRDRAETIKKYLIESNHYKNDAIKLTKVSIALDSDGEGNLPPPKAIAEFSPYDNCYFNLAGGLNYQIAACIAEMAGECHLLYPESSRVHYFRCESRTVKDHTLFNLPSPVDVLALQGVPVTAGTAFWSRPALLDGLQSACRLSLPEHSKENVVIGGVHFDYIYNIGNELRFLKVIEVAATNAIKNKAEQKKVAEKGLADVRAIISLALNRDRFGELFHRNIIVLTDDVTLAERMRDEGGGKINVVRVKYLYNKRGITNKIANKVCSDLIKYFLLPPNFDATAHNPKTLQTGNNIEGDTKFHVVLGRDILPTLISIWTHQPKDLVLLYTPGDQEIDSYRTAIIDNKKCLPVGSISLKPISIIGEEILTNTYTGTAAEVNITPGTKAQAAFLAMWAKTNNAAIYSLLTPQKKAVEIGGSCYKEMSAPDPVTLLKLSGVPIKSNGENQKSLKAYEKTHESILYFIKNAIQSDVSLKSVPFNVHNGYKKINTTWFKQKHKKAMLKFGDDRPLVVFPTEGGLWFERLIGYCFLQSGANDVAVRIRTGWSEERQKHLEKTHKGEVFMTDIDVSARFGSTYYVVSCKATEKKDTLKETNQAVAFASLFGRFAIPLVAFLKYAGEPFKVNDVYVFGYETFSDPQALTALITKAVRDRTKTEPDD